MNRILFREHCFKILFAMDFHSEEEKKEQLDLYFEQPSEYEEIENRQKTLHEVKFDEFDKNELKEKILLYLEKSEEIDKILESAIEGWTFKRLARVEKNILRLACFEIKYVDSINTSIAINEAVNLTKKFANQESYAFVNAILSKLV